MSNANYSYFLVDTDPLQRQVSSYVLTIDQQVADSFVFGITPTVNLGDDTVDLTKLTLANINTANGSPIGYRHIVDLPSGQRQETVIVSSITSLQITDIPEPATVALVGAAVLGVAATRRRKPSFPTA